MLEAPRYIVRDLSDRGLIRVEDGNHGEYRPRKNEFVEHGVAFIRAADLGEIGINFINASKINETAVSRITKSYFRGRGRRGGLYDRPARAALLLDAN